MFLDEPATAPLGTKPTETAAVTSKPETSEPDSPTETAAVTSKPETSEPDSPTEPAAVTSKPETSEPDSPTEPAAVTSKPETSEPDSPTEPAAVTSKPETSEPEVPDKTKPTVGTQPKTKPTTEQVNSTSSEYHTSRSDYACLCLVPKQCTLEEEIECSSSQAPILLRPFSACTKSVYHHNISIV